MKFDFESVVICGQEFMRNRKELRGPFKVIAKLAKNGWSERAKIVAHVTSCGDVWHSVEFRTIRDAKEAFATVRSKRGAMSVGEYLRRCQGQYA